MQTTEQSTHEKCVLYWNEIPTFHNLMQTQILKNELYTHISDLKKRCKYQAHLSNLKFSFVRRKHEAMKAVKLCLF